MSLYLFSYYKVAAYSNETYEEIAAKIIDFLKALYLVVLFKDNLFEWHFTVRGPADTDFDGGIYHGRILLPVDYPMKPPSVILLTVAFSKY